MRRLKLIIIIVFSLVSYARISYAVDIPANMQGGFKDKPTTIDSDSLTLKNNERVFEYRGNVHLVQGDIDITCDSLTGSYDEKNKIKELVAKKSVVITRAPDVLATAEKARYDAALDALILTESPELTQNDNTLTAEVVKMFLKENRSVAEGKVKVKIANRTSPIQ